MGNQFPDATLKTQTTETQWGNIESELYDVLGECLVGVQRGRRVVVEGSHKSALGHAAAVQDLKTTQADSGKLYPGAGQFIAQAFKAGLGHDAACDAVSTGCQLYSGYLKGNQDGEISVLSDSTQRHIRRIDGDTNAKQEAGSAVERVKQAGDRVLQDAHDSKTRMNQ